MAKAGTVLTLAITVALLAWLVPVRGDTSGSTTVPVQSTEKEFETQLLDAHSTTGPKPPEGIEMGMRQTSAPHAEVVLTSVPGYDWRHGCGPTAAGMVLAYWDGNGFGNLVSGSAATQTAAVNEMIASQENYDDYCEPLDYSWRDPQPLDDKSELPVGDEHTGNCVADFMQTSQSYYNNYYGWSYFSRVDDALRDYVALVEPEYSTTVTNQYWGTLTWASYRAEIDAGRPVVFLVDTDGNGGTDHFVTAIGYNDVTNQYACRNTWDADVHWFAFEPLSSGQPWGIYGATLFDIDLNTPNAPTNLQANAVSGSQINLAWTDNSGVETGFQVERSPNGSSSWSHIATLGANTTSYPDSGLGAGTTHYYRVRAINGQGESTYSNTAHATTTPAAWTDFVYAPCTCRNEGSTGGFNSQFNGSADGWVIHSGTWWIDSGAWFTTNGISDAWSSASYGDTYANFDYEASLWSAYCTTCSHGLMVRGTPTPLGSGNRWNSGYGFYIARTGRYAIFEYSGGVASTIQSWTDSGFINTGSEWNDLRVVANGSSLAFYVNGFLVWSGSDNSYTSGRVGIIMYRTPDSTHQLWADWATLSPVAATTSNQTPSPEQQESNRQASKQAKPGPADSVSPE